MTGILAQLGGNLGGNPFNTMVGQKIEQATDASLASENWALNMEICDIINDTDEGPKDAIKAIRKRLQQNAGKNYSVVMYTLTVLETCVKNCGRRFHLLVTQKDFVLELVKLIGPKNDPPTVVQEKVLSLIQSWADAFRNVADMQGVVQVYTDLKQKGIEFPMTDLDAMAPIHTPHRTVIPHPSSQTLPRPHHEEVPRTDAIDAPVLPPQPVSPNRVPTGAARASLGPVHLSPDQLAKLRSELDVVQGNMKVFGEMLTELAPSGGDQHSSDLDLLNDLRDTCRSMQSRLVQLIDKVANEEVTNELLRVNDEMNNLFVRYERFEKKQMAMMGNQPVKSTTSPSATNPIQENGAPPLIDLGGDTDETAAKGATGDMGKTASQLASLSLISGSTATTLGKINSVSTSNTKPPILNAAGAGLEGSDEFDMFAQSRNLTYESTKSTGSSYADNSNVNQVSTGLGAVAQNKTLVDKESVDELYQFNKEGDFDEMEEWLKEKQANSNQGGPESITSSEFDRFLAERAAAAENLPSAGTRGNTTTTPESRGRTGPNSRHMEREETENTLFAL